MVLPERSYFICTTPRSGSTLLAEALRATGVAGRPREYFQELPSTLQPATPRDYVGLVPDPVVREVLGAPGGDDHTRTADWPAQYATWAQYLAWVVEEGTTPDGIFAAKVMWRYFNGLLLRLRETLGVRGGDGDLALLQGAFGPPRFVFLTRADKVSQAVSLWRAIQTWSWRAGDGGRLGSEPVYSFAAIDHLRRRLATDEADWLRWFSAAGIKPFELEYQELADGYADALVRVLRSVGAPEAIALDGSTPLTRQADEISKSWVERYRAEVARPNGAAVA